MFIGIDMRRSQLVAELERCLATPEEEQLIRSEVDRQAAGLSSSARTPPDPFLPWPDIQDIMDAGEVDDNEVEEEEEEDIEEEGTDEEADLGPAGRWQPGVMLEDISDGASELQRLLDDTEQPAVVRAAALVLGSRGGSRG